MPDSISGPSRVRKNADNPAPRRRPRLTIAWRLMAVLSATAALSTALAMLLHDRTLTTDLQRAAEERLERAGRAADRLVDSHLDAAAERYRAISGTPQLRANVEVDHAPTLAFYARTLRSQENADLLVFADDQGRVVAASGNERLWPAAQDVETKALVVAEGFVYAVVTTDLRSTAGLIGRMVAVERLTPAALEYWSELCGAEVALSPAYSDGEGELHRTARSLGSLDLVVRTDLAAEQAALRRSRASLLVAGSVAIALAWVACALLARSFVRPIRLIRDAAERIRQGDLDLRVDIARDDEVGEVARAFDLMLDSLDSSRREVESHLVELRTSQDHLANAQKLARLGSFELTIEKGQAASLSCSAQFRELYQLDPEPAPDDVDRVLSRMHPEDRENLEAALRVSLVEGTSLHTDFRIILEDGSERILHAQARPERGVGEDSVRLVGTTQDVTERRRTDEQIRFMSYHDGLTGLGNRSFFLERLSATLSRPGRRDTSVGVIYLDLDRFKRVNDTLGHTVGDELLRAVAGRLVRCLRESDLVTRPASSEEFGTSVSRLGGDEFIILLDELRDARDLSRVAQRILNALEPPFLHQAHELVIGASIGIAVWPMDGEDADTLLRNADSAMYHAKEQGRNNYQFYAQSMNEAAIERLELEERIRRGLERGEFEMHYQPKVELATSRVTGYEALMRWGDPDQGMLGPGTFIPVAEQCGLIVSLGEFALREACHQLARWQAEPPAVCGGAPPRVSVNLSVHQFRSGKLVSEVKSALEDAGARPEGLDLEITESAVVHDEQLVIEILEELRALGISVSLDDFGTGQSSLSYLRRLPVDTLKIDISFIRNIVDSDKEARLTAAIVAMGKARDLCVVAEGVETEAQRELLASWGCDEIQGFLISPALPAAEASALS